MHVLTAVDPRVYGPKITKTGILPHISRHALKRVKHRLKPPTECEYCLSEVVLVRNSVIYGREYGKWPYAYRCTGCRASVGVHPDTDLPLGTLADQDTKDARKAAKALFHTVQNIHIPGKDKFEKRDRSYQWLSKVTGIPPEECHFSMFTYDRAQVALAACYACVLEGRLYPVVSFT